MIVIPPKSGLLSFYDRLIDRVGIDVFRNRIIMVRLDSSKAMMYLDAYHKVKNNL